MKQGKLLLLITIFSGSSLLAFKNIETHKKDIATNLQKNNPELTATFTELCNQYDRVVINFFDTNNDLPLTRHIHDMEQDLALLTETSNNPAFVSVRPMLLDLNSELQNLITLLKEYRSSKNSVGLALKVRKFKKLLPSPINTWSNYSLFWALHHRLHC